MLSFTPISSAPISGLAGGNIVINAPAFVSTGTLSASLNDVMAQALTSTGSLAGTPVSLVQPDAFDSTSELSVEVWISIGSPVFASVSALDAVPAPFRIVGESYRYYFTLTGAPDGMDEVIIPVSSFQCRLRSGDPTYLSLAIPYATAYADAINARPNGEMVIEMALIMGGVEYVRSEIVRVDLENIRMDEGPQSSTITLTGHKTQTRTPVSVTLVRPVYRAVTNGAIRLRFAEPHLYLKPGDTVICDGDSFTADEISIFIGASDGGNITRTMEVAESN